MNKCFASLMALIFLLTPQALGRVLRDLLEYEPEKSCSAQMPLPPRRK